MPAYAETLRRVCAVLSQRWRWLFVALALAVCVQFQLMSQNAFEMSGQHDAMWCMALFTVLYISSLAFILSFDLIRNE